MIPPGWTIAPCVICGFMVTTMPGGQHYCPKCKLRYERVEQDGIALRGPAAMTTRRYWRAVRVSDDEQIATGSTRAECERNTAEALALIERMRR
jgi:hypothetical protein